MPINKESHTETMGYRTEGQALTESINQIISGIDVFRQVASARIDSGECREEHEDHLFELTLQMNTLRLNLIRFLRETW